MKKQMQNKKGVSLIVLVITVIVMVILAGTIILMLDNAEIIERAEKSVEKYNLNEVKSLANVAWGEAYMNGARTEQELKDQVAEILNKKKIDLTPYYLEITTKGVEVWLTSQMWIQQGLTVTNGEVTLEIGDSIAYDETNGGSITGLTNTEWAVLGANEKGELLIMSTSNVVSSYDFGPISSDGAVRLKESQNSWLTGVNQLNELCAPYGKGKGATGVRSIRVEDVNKVTGYDPETAGYQKGKIDEYGNEVTYSYNGTTKPSYAGSNEESGTLSDEHSSGFHYYNGEEFVTVSDLTTGTIGTSFASLKSNVYSYDPTTLTTSSTGEQKGIGADTKAYIMLFGNNENTSNTTYWLASPYVHARSGSALFGMLRVGFVGNDSDDVNYSPFLSSGGAFGKTSFALLSLHAGVRAVVSLQLDIQLEGSSADGWTY